MSVIRVSLVIWLIVAGAVAFGLYQVKYEVQHLEHKLSSVRQDIKQDRNALHVLEAEWSYLNRPQRLERLAEKHLEMEPATTKQVAAVTQLPPRITHSLPASAERDALPKMDGVPVPFAKPWSLEPRRAKTRLASAEPAPQTPEPSKPQTTEPRTAKTVPASLPEPRRTQSAKVPEESRTISVGHIKISLGGGE